jgi:hypothetical protein
MVIPAFGLNRHIIFSLTSPLGKIWVFWAAHGKHADSSFPITFHIENKEHMTSRYHVDSSVLAMPTTFSAIDS